MNFITKHVWEIVPRQFLRELRRACNCHKTAETRGIILRELDKLCAKPFFSSLLKLTKFELFIPNLTQYLLQLQTGAPFLHKLQCKQNKRQFSWSKAKHEANRKRTNSETLLITLRAIK